MSSSSPFSERPSCRARACPICQARPQQPLKMCTTLLTPTHSVFKTVSTPASRISSMLLWSLHHLGHHLRKLHAELAIRVHAQHLARRRLRVRSPRTCPRCSPYASMLPPRPLGDAGLDFVTQSLRAPRSRSLFQWSIQRPKNTVHFRGVHHKLPIVDMPTPSSGAEHANQLQIPSRSPDNLTNRQRRPKRTFWLTLPCASVARYPVSTR